MAPRFKEGYNMGAFVRFVIFLTVDSSVKMNLSLLSNKSMRPNYRIEFIISIHLGNRISKSLKLKFLILQ